MAAEGSDRPADLSLAETPSSDEPMPHAIRIACATSTSASASPMDVCQSITRFSESYPRAAFRLAIKLRLRLVENELDSRSHCSLVPPAECIRTVGRGICHGGGRYAQRDQDPRLREQPIIVVPQDRKLLDAEFSDWHGIR